MRCWEDGSGWITSVCGCHSWYSRQWLCNILRSILKLSAAHETHNDWTYESVLESFHNSRNESSYHHCDFDVCKYVSFWTPYEAEIFKLASYIGWAELFSRKIFSTFFLHLTQSLDEPLSLTRAKQEENVVVEVATICKGNATKQLANLRRLVTSMMDQSAGSKIRLTILSDPDSWPSANEVLRNAIGHCYAKGEKSTLMLFVNKCRPLPLRNTKIPKEEYARDLIS